MKLSSESHSNKFWNIWTLTLAVFFSISFTTCDSHTKTDLVYKILKGENQQNEQLIMLLHGMNSNTGIWNEFAQNINHKTLMIAVEAPIKTEINSYRWYDIDVTKNPFESDIDQMTESTNKIENLINELKFEHRIKSNNIVIAGFSQGAILSLNLALTNPELIYGVGVFSGMLPEEIENRISKEIQSLPVFITHGSEDNGIDISFAKKTQSFLRGKNAMVEMTIEKSGHYITNKQFQDFISWTKNLNCSE